MFGLLAHQGVGSGRVARPWGETGGARSQQNPEVDDGRPLFVPADKGIVDAVQRTAERPGVPMARIALAGVMRNPVVSAPIIGPTKVSHLDDAAAALEIDLTEDEISQLERHYSPRLPTYF